MYRITITLNWDNIYWNKARLAKRLRDVTGWSLKDAVEAIKNSPFSFRVGSLADALAAQAHLTTDTNVDKFFIKIAPLTPILKED